MLALTVRVHRDGRRDDSAPLLENPFEITPALMFGLLFVLLTLLTGIVRRILGDQGLLVLGSLVGVTDIDPFLLSLVQGANDQIPLLVQAMILATMSNTLAKGLYFGFLVKEERVHTALRFGLWAALHLPVLLFS
jgi:uncharacterized membrane protein (DUF4010 family)